MSIHKLGYKNGYRDFAIIEPKEGCHRCLLACLTYSPTNRVIIKGFVFLAEKTSNPALYVLESLPVDLRYDAINNTKSPT